MHACKTCGCYLRARNKSGYCGDHYRRQPTPGPSCAKCDTKLPAANTTGTCGPCWHAIRRAAGKKRDKRIASALKAGGKRQDVADRLGESLSRVHKIAQTLAPTLPTQRLAGIIDAAARLACISRADLIGHSRRRCFVLPRQAVCLLGIEAGHSSTKVAQVMGRDHTTILHGRDAACALAKRSPDFAEYLDQIRADKPTAPEACIRAVEPPRPVPSRPKPRRVDTPIILKSIRSTAKRAGNDFLADADEDTGHAFHRGIAAGSIALRRAIERARADAQRQAGNGARAA